jgi:hypothetical protein
VQTPIEEALVIIEKLEQLEKSVRGNLSDEARSTLEAVERHERNGNQAPETFQEGMDFYSRIVSEEDRPPISEYRLLKDTLLRARWPLTMLERAEE